MAELDPDDPIRFAAAASAVALTTSRKLIRNFRYYRSTQPDTIHRDELAGLCRHIRQDLFGLRNLMDSEPGHSPFYVSLAGEIDDRLEELHRKLLFFDAEKISTIIPLIDSFRSFWKGLDQPSFYGEKLISALDHQLPSALEITENKILTLPETAAI
ncbi:MAG: hypothetical protein JJU46_07935 [Balneolaceae bacterium]|nr:hypothetical protein [Balneolaceae bacterium]MCH8548464.1 hypothetical protein [Balneolaceae bacterium]